MALSARPLLSLAFCLLAACGGQPATSVNLPTASAVDAPNGPEPTVSAVDAPNGSEPMSSAPNKPAADAACPRLDAALAELAALDDPTELARALQIPLENGSALVVVTIAPADVGRLSQYGARVSGQAGDQAQALVPLDQLCALANDPAVLAVGLPMVVQLP